MATPDELREQLAAARAEFRSALEQVGDAWEKQPAGGGEGEESWSPRQAAEHAIGTETFFATAVCKACGYPGVDKVDTNYPTAQDALKAFDEVVEMCNKKLKHISEGDLQQTHERFGKVEDLLNMNINHMREHAAQMKETAGV